METLAINQKVRVMCLDPHQGGVKKHFGWVEDIVKNIFDSTDLYMVRMRIGNKPVVRTFARESLIPVQIKNIKHINP